MENTHELSNEELLFIYYTNKRLVDRFESAFKNKALRNLIPTPIGIIVSLRSLTDEEITKLKNEPDYVISKNIVDKLGIIVEFIESTGDDYSYIKNIFKQEDEPLTGGIGEQESSPEI